MAGRLRAPFPILGAGAACCACAYRKLWRASVRLWRPRGIGHAISVELKKRGFRVAANYGGNDEAAQKFQAMTGIPIFKWDVGDYEACTKD